MLVLCPSSLAPSLTSIAASNTTLLSSRPSSFLSHERNPNQVQPPLLPINVATPPHTLLKLFCQPA